jgi:hypothetical protein
MKKLILSFALGLLLFAPQQRPLSVIADDLERLASELRTYPITINVPAGGDVQAALNQAKGGDSIVLQAGVRYVGALVLPAKSGAVTVRSSATLPDRRIGPADAALLPILASGSTGKVIDGTGAANWTFDGVQFEAGGVGEVVTLQDAINITFNRVLIVGGVNGQKRAIRGNGQHITLTRSYIANIWAPGQDSQAFCAWDGAGPYTLVDNYLEAASENVMFGGADSLSDARVPADILVDGNTLHKPASWVFTGKALKNLIEFKAARRFVVRNNDLSGNWTDAQTGYAILVKSVNQNGTAPWTSTEDGLIENNVLRDSDNGVNLLGHDPDHVSGQTTRIVFRGNDFQTRGTAFQVGGGFGLLTLERNTIDNGWTFLYLYGAASQALTVQNNLAKYSGYGVKGDSTAAGTPTLTARGGAYVFAQNALIGALPAGVVYPASTYFDLVSVPAGVVVGR